MTDNSLAPLDANLPTDPSRVKETASAINLNDPSLSITYGTKTMTEISRFADDLLGRVRAKDAGPVGDTLTNLLLKVKDINITEINDEKGFLANLPLVGSLFNSVEKTVARFDTLSGQIDSIVSKLDEAMVGLLRDIEVLEQLYKHNEVFYQELSIYIEAGKERLEQARNVELLELHKEAEASASNMAAQSVRDFAEKINRFERRLHDLQLSRTITLQTAPQIRMIQGNNQTLAEKIQTSILATIPIWKNQMIVALSLHSQKGAARLQKEVADTTNELLRQNAAMLESATVETAREVERSVVDVETLRDVQQRLISTIEQTLQIAEDGRTRRIAVEKELQEMEQDLRQRLTSLGAAKAAQALDHAQGSAAIAAGGSNPDGAATKP